MPVSLRDRQYQAELVQRLAEQALVCEVLRAEHDKDLPIADHDANHHEGQVDLQRLRKDYSQVANELSITGLVESWRRHLGRILTGAVQLHNRELQSALPVNLSLLTGLEPALDENLPGGNNSKRAFPKQDRRDNRKSNETIY